MEKYGDFARLLASKDFLFPNQTYLHKKQKKTALFTLPLSHQAVSPKPFQDAKKKKLDPVLVEALKFLNRDPAAHKFLNRALNCPNSTFFFVFAA